MHFISETNNNGVEITRLINASSWSTCFAYLEGTGESISQILKTPDSLTVVVGDPNTTDCYQVNLKDTVTQQSFNYIVFESTYQNLQNWISQQTDKKVNSIIYSQKTYVNV